MNTKNPNAYQKLHQAAIEKYMEGQDNEMQGHLNELLITDQNQNVEALFPRLSRELKQSGK